MSFQTAEIINLLFVPMLAIYLHYKRNGRALEPRIDLLVQYGVAAAFNFVLAKTLLSVVNRIVPTITSVDSAHYTVAALFSAWLLPRLYAVARNVSVKIEVEKLAPAGKRKKKVGESGDKDANEEKEDL